MSDTRRKSGGVKWVKPPGDLRLSVIQRGLSRYTHRQIQRWAETGKIPGAYRLKRGHWRVRDCQAFRRWWRGRRARPLRWAIEGYPAGLFDGAAKELTSFFKKYGPHLSKLEKIIALKTNSGSQGSLEDNPRRIWDLPIARTPRQWHAMARRADEKTLDVMVAVGELTAKNITPTRATVAKLMGLSRATFYSRDLNGVLKRCLQALNAGMTTTGNKRRSRTGRPTNLA